MTPHDWLNSENTVKRSKKPYAHFDLRTDIGKQKFYISNPHKVAAHGFYPFIHYQIKTIKFNKTKGPRVSAGGRKTVSVPAVMSAGLVLAYIKAR